MFADEYLANGLNGTQAYLAVYKSVKNKKTAEAAASRLLSNDKVKKYIEGIQKESSEALKITREDILSRLNTRSKIVEQLHILATKEKLTPQEESQFARLTMVIKTSDANKADEVIARMLGFNEPDKLDVNIIDYKANFGN